jgi:hypothetical protein
MKKLRKILIYGNSVIMGTLRASLQDCSQFEVTILWPPLPGKQRLEEMKPDVIFFDLEAEHPQAAFSLLDTCSDLMLIGISPDRNIVRTWTGQQLRELSMPGLLDLINQPVKDSIISSFSNPKSGLAH